MKIKFFLLVILVFSLKVQMSLAASLVYVPEELDGEHARIVVVLHGCLQTPEAMSLGTGWNRIADQNNLVIIYPQVPSGSNPGDCWSWFLRENQSSQSGQLRLVRDEVLKWKSLLQVPDAPVFVTGISSGAATTAGLLACFPKDFVAGAIHSGPSYGLASTTWEGESVLKGFPPKSSVISQRPCHPEDFQRPVMVIQGSADSVVNPVNIKHIISDFFPEAVVSKSKEQISNGLKFKIEDYEVSGQLRGRVLLIEELGHAWAGFTENLKHSSLLGPSGQFPTQVPFFSPQGPSSTNLIFEFFDSVPISYQ